MQIFGRNRRIDGEDREDGWETWQCGPAVQAFKRLLTFSVLYSVEVVSVSG